MVLGHKLLPIGLLDRLWGVDTSDQFQSPVVYNQTIIVLIMVLFSYLVHVVLDLLTVEIIYAFWPYFSPDATSLSFGQFIVGVKINIDIILVRFT